jgi:periplasmic divalent cation tolerance protein
MNMVERLVVIMTTTDARDKAESMAASIVEQRLAACVQIDGPIQSWYRWQGKVEKAEEWRLSIKTTQRVADKAIESIRRMHSYELPEIVLFAIDRSDDGYARWVGDQVV